MKTKKKFTLLMPFVLISLVLLGSIGPQATWASCKICWKDGGYFDRNPWYCKDAAFGYEICSSTGTNCANREPLCERSEDDEMCWLRFNCDIPVPLGP